jgi:phosphotriesterase-related protein
VQEVDTCLKQNLVTYGGNGYAHILRNVVPWVREKGITEEQLFTIMVNNPARILSFSKYK